MRKTAIALLLVTPTVAFAGDVGFTVGLGQVQRSRYRMTMTLIRSS